MIEPQKVASLHRKRVHQRREPVTGNRRDYRLIKGVKRECLRGITRQVPVRPEQNTMTTGERIWSWCVILIIFFAILLSTVK
jgi:hypothetical protein